MALHELTQMGVESIITFDAHDPRVQNAIPLNSFETVQPTYQFIKALLKNVPDLKVDADHLMVISPDEGAMGRAVYYSNVLGLDMGMFYREETIPELSMAAIRSLLTNFLAHPLKAKTYSSWMI